MNISQKIIKYAQLLASGEIDPVEVSKWAVDVEVNNQQEVYDLAETDTKVAELLEGLQLAGQIGDQGLLYGPEDFKEWLMKYESN